MFRKWIVPSMMLMTLAFLIVAAVRAGSAAPETELGTAFTYQGQLNFDGQAVDETCDFQFDLYDDELGDVQIGATQTISEVAVSEGLFTVQLDFGAGAFQGDARWLGIQVQCQGDAAYVDLGLQALTAAPYALYAMGVPWAGISDVPAGFADGVDDVSSVVSGTAVYAGEGLNQIAGGDAVTLSVSPSYRLPQVCASGQIAEWDGAAWVCGDDDTGSGGGGWSLTGNAGTNSTTNFLGTTDEVSLTLAVSGTPALRLEPAGGVPNLIGGDNDVSPGAYGVTIGGGDANQAFARYDFIGGGRNNMASAEGASVVGGDSNQANGVCAAVGGGDSNQAGQYAATVAGGVSNMAEGWNSTIGGGQENVAGGTAATIGGGDGNVAGGWYATIAGGLSNVADGDYSFAAGRRANADHDGTFVWADATNADFASTGPDQFLVRAGGGVSFTTEGMGVHVDGQTVWHAGNDGHTSGLDADTLDGFHASDLGGDTDYQNVIVVAKSGGDHTSIQAAINEAGATAAVDNAYLVWVAPGVYAEAVTLSPYVHLQGAGQEATIITSTVGDGWIPATATLVLAHHTSVRDLTVRNGGFDERNVAMLARGGVTQTLVSDVTVQMWGTGENNYAIFVQSLGDRIGVTLQNVTALAESDVNSNYALYNMGEEVTLRGGFFTGRGGSMAYGIYNTSSGALLDAEGVTALCEDGGENIALMNRTGAMMFLRGGAFTARGGTRAEATYNRGTLIAEGITALAENGSAGNYGFFAYIGAATTLHGGSFIARGGEDTHGIFNSGSGTTLEAEDVLALGEGGTIDNYGLYHYNDAPIAILRGSTFIGRGGENAQGIFTNGTDTTLEAYDIVAQGEGGSSANYGLRNTYNAVANVSQSVLEGTTLSASGTITLSNSRLVEGGADSNVVCVLVTRGTTISSDGSSCP